jgi:hypothetical protein
MPNWCNNNIEITGPADKILALWTAAQAEDGGLLNAMVPMPVELGDTKKGTGDELQTEKYDGFTNWYDWSVARWGTKWDVDLEGIEYTDNGDGTASISGYFDSAWAPPIEAYNRFLEANEDCSLNASYYEMGCDFAGLYDNGDDEYLEDLQDEYKLPEDQQSDLFKRLDEEWNLSEQFAEYDEDEDDDDEVVDNTDAVNALFNPKE